MWNILVEIYYKISKTGSSLPDIGFYIIEFEVNNFYFRFNRNNLIYTNTSNSFNKHSINSSSRCNTKSRLKNLNNQHYPHAAMK